MIDALHNARTCDAVIVGAGVAGLSAAVFLGRAGLNTIVYDAGKPRIMAVDRVREYLGFDGVTPSELLSRARAEVTRYGVSIRPERVLSIEPRADGLFDLRSAADIVCTRTIVLATGLMDQVPALAELSEVWGRDLRVCPCFDGYEVRDQRFVVFGLPERLAHMGAWVSMWSPHVTVVTERALAAADEEKLRLLDIPVVTDQVTGLRHREEQLVAVVTRTGATIACDAAWVALASKASSDLAASICDVDDAGLAKTDDAGRTSRPGVFAIGNASANGVAAHLAHAAASGTHVGPFVTLYLLESRLTRARANASAGA